MTTLRELAADVARVNAANGWNEISRSATESTMLLISEIVEAFEWCRKGLGINAPSDHLADRSGFEEEIADVAIRALDTLNRASGGDTYLDLGGNLASVRRAVIAPSADVSEQLFSGIIALSTIAGVSEPEPTERVAIAALRWAVTVADIHGTDLEAVIHEKLAYNETRGYRHGGKNL